MEPGEMVDQIAARVSARSKAKPPEALDPAKSVADIQARTSPRPPKDKPERPATVTRLPFWPDALRAAPSAAFRSALFPALGRVQRRRLWDETIFSVNGVTVTFRGEQFDQSDLDVLLEIWHRLRDHDDTVEFAAHDLLLSLGHPTGKSNHEWLRRVIDRLTAGYVKINDHHAEYFGHLVDGGRRDKDTKRYSLSIHSDLARLFCAAWSSLDIDQRRALKTPTARSLHAYLSSHRDPGPHKIVTLIGIAGLTGVNAKTTVTKALAELEAVGFLSMWSIDKHLVTLRRAVDN
jgi:hypothetical protein